MDQDTLVHIEPLISLEGLDNRYPVTASQNIFFGMAYFSVVVDRVDTPFRVMASLSRKHDSHVDTLVDSGEDEKVRVGSLAPNNVETGAFEVHVKFNYLFSTNANTQAVYIKQQQTPQEDNYVYGANTGDDGKVTFHTGRPRRRGRRAAGWWLPAGRPRFAPEQTLF